MFRLIDKTSVAKKNIDSEYADTIANAVIRICNSAEEGARARAICEGLRMGEAFNSQCYSIEKAIR